MKKGSMLTALLLAMVMCFSSFAGYAEDAVSNELTTLGTYQQLLTTANLLANDGAVALDLSAGSIEITPTGYTQNGATYANAGQKYIISSNSTTANDIRLTGELNAEITLNGVTRSAGTAGLIFDAVKDTIGGKVTVLLQGTNTIGQLHYTGDAELKITSASGDGSTEGTLNVVAATTTIDGKGDSWSAAIGGNDSYSDFTGLTIAGGTIVATATNGAAIGGAGNGIVEIMITGGNVTATNNGNSATIGGGGGQSGDGGKGTVVITGGTVTATNNGKGVAIGGGSTDNTSAEPGDADIQLLGGTVVANANSQPNGFDISAGLNFGDNTTYGATTVKIGNVSYSGMINTRADIEYTSLIFDLSKASVVFNGNSFRGKDSNGNLISGTHKEENRYIVRQSASTTTNTINLNGKISGTVHLELDGINSTAFNSIDIPASSGIEKDVVLYLRGENRINNLRYYTGAEATSLKDNQSNSTLEITSADGAGSTNGSLLVYPPSLSAHSQPNTIYYNAGIGGTDNQAGVAGLTISGGTIKVKVDATHDCSAIGGGGNGYAEITITGGYIEAENASTGATIGGGVGYTAEGSGCDILITGGTVIATNNGKKKTDHGINDQVNGVAIGGGSSYEVNSKYDANVTITGGSVTATVPAGKTAIGAGNSNVSNAGDAYVTVEGGIVHCTGGIGGGSSNNGNGGNATLNVTGGNLTVRGFIGGGTTKNGTSGGTATVNIGGADTVVKAASIGGGIAEAKNVVNWAKVYITNGQIQAQVVMEGAGSIFNMSGGTIDNSNAKKEGFEFKVADGGAAYVGQGVATMSGGTIQNCTTDGKGGAIYVTGGTFTLKGTGTIDNCDAAYGGAVAVEKGTATIEGGLIDDCSAAVGGAVYVKGTNDSDIYFTMTGGTLSNNTATNASQGGGAVYVETGSAQMSGGNIETNNAANGAGVYVHGGSFKMANGTITSNTATANGGGVYMDGGAFNMDNGTITSNTATGNGGAVYMDGGNFTMKNGQINSNEANNGGAVYMASTNAVLTMTSGTMMENKALLNKAVSDLNLAGGDGGAIFAMGGILYIGVENCPGGEGVLHADGLPHPVITKNVAQDCGGGIAISKNNTAAGTVHLYCCDATANEALYKGTGKNVFMDGGNVYLYDGAKVGVPHDPDLVVVGGELHNMITTQKMVTINYHKDQTTSAVGLTGLVAVENTINLPDAEYFFTKPDGMTFVGWTQQGGTDLDVRDKDDYVPSGEPYYVKDDTTVSQQSAEFYAVWMPSNYNITFVDNMERTVISQAHLPKGYTLTKDKATLTINAPTKPGYAVVGYYIYQNLDQDANWGDEYEPVYNPVTGPFTHANLDLEHKEFQDVQKITLEAPGASYVLDTGDMKFGHITLVAVFEPQFASMRITKMPATAEGNFIFHIVGDSLDSDIPDVDMYVTAKAGENNAVLITELPVGTYTVTEQTDWSWRYQPSANGINVTIDDPATVEELTFTNEQTNFLWLDDEDAVHNVLGTPAPVTTGTPADN